MTSTRKLNVAALISGGKDSTYNMMQCVKDGHNIVCLVHMCPPSGIEELDSYMYQSVGHNSIDLYAECMQLPLIRGTIKRKPNNISMEYTAPDHLDEVEDLFEVLQLAVNEFPQIDAVSSGAILSTYQYNRVANICDRLHLVSLAYLWQADQGKLIQEMVDDHVEAVLIKVAAGGLSADNLGKSIREMIPKLHELNHKYGVNVCGEGGEYETLTLDCPLFQKERLEIRSYTKIVHRDDPFAPVVFMKLEKLEKVPK